MFVITCFIRLKQKKENQRREMSSIVKEGILIRSTVDVWSNNRILNGKKYVQQHSDFNGVGVGGRRAQYWQELQLRLRVRSTSTAWKAVRSQAILTPTTPPTTKKVRKLIH